MASVSQKLTLSLRKSISDKLNRLPLRYYGTHKKGNILSRVTSDLEKVSDTLQEGLTQTISSIITVIGAFVMMMLISPSLTLVALGTIIASILITALISTKTHCYYVANQAALGELNANIEEAFTGNNLIKAFNLQDNMVKTNDELNEKLRKTSTKAQFITYAINPLVRLMGPTGAGKTTLVNLLMRFYELQGGKITIDGMNINSISRKELRSILGMVLQDTWLFNGTVAENIAYGRSDATEEEIKQAAKAARIDYFIRTLPYGYQTIV